MARYFFHLHECGTVTVDEEGTLLADAEVARAKAIEHARAIMSAEVRDGRLCLGCCIEVLDESGSRVADVPFREAIALSGIAA